MKRLFLTMIAVTMLLCASVRAQDPVLEDFCEWQAEQYYVECYNRTHETAMCSQLSSDFFYACMGRR